MDASIRRGEGWRAIAAFVLCGLLGGGLAAGLATATLPTHTALLDATPFPSFMGAAALAGGVLGGWFVAILVLARSHGGVHCPRCGTVNVRGFTVCRACELRPT